ncbi:MAG: hydroxyacid dehydrogenase [Rhodocyclales bacterium]|nr:hydroxyacid dehydrogenase [Rhodocyclales bacterium]
MKTLFAISNPVLIDNIFDREALNRLGRIADVDWAPTDGSFTQEYFTRHISAYDACITSWDSPRLTGQAGINARRLRFLGHAAGTLASYVESAFFEREVIVVNSGEPLAISTAECTLALMMSAAWNLRNYERRIHEGVWSKSRQETVMGLYGQSIGIIGLGHVARHVIKYLKPFEPRILLHCPYASAEEAQQLGVTLLPLDDLLQQSQIISLHDTLTTHTRGSIGKRELGLMRDGALLVNTARSEILDSAALQAELESGRLNAALDVFDKEPLSPDNPLLNLPNVICSPHIAGISAYWRKKIGGNIVDALEAYVAGRPITKFVTAERFRIMSAH